MVRGRAIERAGLVRAVTLVTILVPAPRTSMYGRSIGRGIRRSTFIIGPDGKVARAFKKVSPKTHDDVILKALAELNAAA